MEVRCGGHPPLQFKTVLVLEWLILFLVQASVWPVERCYIAHGLLPPPYLSVDLIRHTECHKWLYLLQP